MPAIPLGINAYQRSDGFVPEVQLLNFYLEKDDSGISPDGTLRIERPRLTLFDTLGGGPIRGMTADPAIGLTLIVSGTALYDNFDAVTGTISGVDNVAIVTTKFTTAICNGSSVWLYDGATITALSMPDGRSVVDVEQLDGYILLLCDDGRFYWIEPGETVVDALNFATAESSADAGIAIRRVGDEFHIFGTVSIEPWQPTGDQDAPFERSSGRIVAAGCLDRDTVRRFDNTLVWVREDGNVCRAGAVPEVISSPAIAERIRKREGAMAAWTFGIDGHQFYVLSIPGQGTFAYDASTRTWPRWGSDDSAVWRAHLGTDVTGAIYAGSIDNGEVWTLAPEGDEAFERIVTATVPVTGRPPRNDSLTVGVGASADTVVRIRYRDGQDDYPEGYYDELEVRAPFDLCTLWRLGAPQPPYREVEVSFIGAERVRVAGAIANEGWQ